MARTRRNGEYRQLLEEASTATTADCIEVGGVGRPVYKPPGSNRSMNASRWVWILANGDPGKLLVLHTCDNEQCVNIQHLYAGTASNNIQDAWDRDRMPNWMDYPRGERQHLAKLTADKVAEIRRLYAAGESQDSIAKRYGVSQRNISAVVRRQSWKHVP